eukprot:EC121066.1.p1 GENE.EC121066.1~~EC121066.1.p1  ORF type:complete len:113 (+),score=5.25 EC121066.1:110-448(+)
MTSKDAVKLPPNVSADDFRLQYIVLTSLAAGKTMVDVHANLKPHLAFVQELDDKHLTNFHGPFLSLDGTNSGMGMYSLLTSTYDEAVAIAKADPMHASGARTFEVRPWLQKL